MVGFERLCNLQLDGPRCDAIRKDRQCTQFATDGAATTAASTHADCRSPDAASTRGDYCVQLLCSIIIIVIIAMKRRNLERQVVSTS